MWCVSATYFGSGCSLLLVEQRTELWNGHESSLPIICLVALFIAQPERKQELKNLWHLVRRF
ncbi:hypothetical protein BHE74_00031585 [Ensete ventricosum]|nr:hypothetical protein BHE74_00031585 [Ensete ventricosum]